MEGIHVSDETIAADVIATVGVGGHYLSDDHTVRHFRREFYRSRLLNREGLAGWAQSGKKKLIDRLRESVSEILATYRPTPLDAKKIRKMEKILYS